MLGPRFGWVFRQWRIGHWNRKGIRVPANAELIIAAIAAKYTNHFML
jgi:hypothetical protein